MLFEKRLLSNSHLMKIFITQYGFFTQVEIRNWAEAGGGSGVFFRILPYYFFVPGIFVS